MTPDALPAVRFAVHLGYLHPSEREGPCDSRDSRVSGIADLVWPHSPSDVERGVRPWFSGCSPDFLCWLPSGEGSSEKSPSDNMRHSRVSHAGVRLRGLGRGRWASSSQATSLPHSFPRRSWEAWRKLATVWGELFLATGSLVSGSRGRGDWEGAVCISSGPPLLLEHTPPRPGPWGQGRLWYELASSPWAQEAFLLAAPALGESEEGHLSALSGDHSLELGTRPSPQALAVRRWP